VLAAYLDQNAFTTLWLPISRLCKTTGRLSPGGRHTLANVACGNACNRYICLTLVCCLVDLALNSFTCNAGLCRWRFIQRYWHHAHLAVFDSFRCVPMATYQAATASAGSPASCTCGHGALRPGCLFFFPARSMPRSHFHFRFFCMSVLAEKAS
jgi:hypothetical protein